MAYKDKCIHNPVTGQEIRFIQTGKETDGKLLEMECCYSANSMEPAPHYHPHQVEDFTVIKGELTVRIKGAIKILRASDTLHIPRNTVHSMWNSADTKTVINWKVQPALETENFLETAIGLAADGKTNEQGVPGLFQVALMANKFSGVFRLARPSFPVQKMVFSLLTPFAYLRGLKPTYKKYID